MRPSTHKDCMSFSVMPGSPASCSSAACMASTDLRPRSVAEGPQALEVSLSEEEQVRLQVGCSLLEGLSCVGNQLVAGGLCKFLGEEAGHLAVGILLPPLDLQKDDKLSMRSEFGLESGHSRGWK